MLAGLHKFLCVVGIIHAVCSSVSGTTTNWKSSVDTKGSDFIKKANYLLEDKDELQLMYKDHKEIRDRNKKLALESSGDDKARPSDSKLTALFKEMHEYLSIAEVDEDSPRHVFTVLADDQGWADIGFNDDTFVTPASDFFASMGVNFKSFYVQNTCSPTRASLLSGRSATNLGVQDGAIVPGEGRKLPLDVRTSGNYFRDAGYSTKFIGKWHLGNRYLNETPSERGYDYYFGFLNGAVDYRQKDIGLLCGTEENNNMAVFGDNCQALNAYDLQENGVPFFDTESYLTDLLADKAIEQIMGHDSSVPMLMHFHPNGPHTPMQAPEDLLPLCNDVTNGSSQAVQPYFRQILCGMTASVDLNMLRVVLALAAKGMLPSTLMLYHSDNGGFEPAGSLNTPLRSEKGAEFEGGIRVPAFMYGRPLLASHLLKSERDDLFSVSDVLPTLLGYAGITTNLGSFDGYNHWNRLALGLPLGRHFVAVNSASNYTGYHSAYIQEIVGTRWKYLFNPSVITFASIAGLDQTYEIEGEFLFNLSEDPGETNNLINATGVDMFFIKNTMRALTLALQLSAAPTQLTSMPPAINVFPSPTGCWLPVDSPYYANTTCPLSDDHPLPPVPLPDNYMDDPQTSKPIKADLAI